MSNDSKFKFEVIKGTLEFPVLKTPRLKYQSETEKEFSVNVILDDEGVKHVKEIMAKHNIPEVVMGHPKIKKDKDGRTFIKLRKNAVSKAGKENFVSVVDSSGKAIPDDVLVGNGTTAAIKVLIFNYGPKKLGGMHLSAVQVHDLVEFKKTNDPFGLEDDSDVSSSDDVSFI